MKREVNKFLEEENGPHFKRSRSSFEQLGVWNNGFPIPPLQYNPLDEPSPLGLRLRKSPSLVDLIQMKLSQNNDLPVEAALSQHNNSGDNKDAKITTVLGATDKQKASNFSASTLRIGSWEYFSRYEGDLVGKCYFAKHKLVWEVLQNGLKRKIEIQWSDIMAIRANCPDDGPGTLTIALSCKPLFFRETNPQPRKHTLWQACGDFTGGQASRFREHFLQCPSGSLNKHYEKLVQSDIRLNLLSRQPEIVLDSPYTQTFEFEITNEAKIPGSSEGSSTSGSTASATSDLSDFLPLSRDKNCVSKGAPSPSSVMDAFGVEGNRNFVARHSQDSKKGEKLSSDSGELLQMPGLRRSMSISDFVNHIGDHITEQITSRNMPSQKAVECQDMLENISEILLSDAPYVADSDEKSLMKKVNSLCCLLQDPPTNSSLQTHVGDYFVEGVSSANQGETNHFIHSTHGEITSHAPSTSKQNFNDILASPMSRKDSFADLLLQLPRTASLPNFLFDIAEGDDR